MNELIRGRGSDSGAKLVGSRDVVGSGGRDVVDNEMLSVIERILSAAAEMQSMVAEMLLATVQILSRMRSSFCQ